MRRENELKREKEKKGKANLKGQFSKRKKR
jgi:hypothetical protein